MSEAKITSPKTLAQMTAEIVENNTAKGWYENCATFSEAMALLHSEVSEALEAWRVWGMQDGTYHASEAKRLKGEQLPDPLKPEGVGSEFADIFIRLLDDAWLFGQIDLEAVASHGRFGINDSFPANMNVLHTMISVAYLAQEEAWDDAENPSRYVKEFGRILTFLRQLCAHYGIDLHAEYERKAAFNRSRLYRHGNKRI